MKQILSTILLLSLFSCSEKKDSAKTLAATDQNFNVDGKQILVYTTADTANYRLTLTDTLTFADFGQPKETQPCVFIDPTKNFQTFIGIGGALTDASAETFAKLPKNKQQEFLQAYFDTQKGIGYTLARTNIH